MTARVHGSGIVHPVALASLFVMLFNDHVLKRVCPGFVSGKLSDFACLVLLPLFLHASCEVACARLGRPLGSVASNRVLAVCAWLSAAVFAAVELLPVCEYVYRVVFGALQWPPRALFALVTGAPVSGLGLVRATADVSDLMALPMVLVAQSVGRRDGPRTRRLAAVVSSLAALLVVAYAPDAMAEDERSWKRHDGWYLGAEAGWGVAFVDSTASISNGFEQELESSATGLAIPVAALELGGSVPATGFVIGVRAGVARLDQPAIEAGGERFRIKDAEFDLFEGQAFVDFYPDPSGGFHAGMAFGVARFSRTSSVRGRNHVGYDLSLEAGYGFWLGKSWSFGPVLRVSWARLSGAEFGDTQVLMPALLASLVCH